MTASGSAQMVRPTKRHLLLVVPMRSRPSEGVVSATQQMRNDPAKANGVSHGRAKGIGGKGGGSRRAAIGPQYTGSMIL